MNPGRIPPGWKIHRGHNAFQNTQPSRHGSATNHSTAPELSMHVPTTAQIRTAIEVLKKLGERLNEHTAHSAMQFLDTQLGDQYASRIEASANEQTTKIQLVAAQLAQWRDELLHQRRHRVSHHV
jgi:hypothetical protein